MVIRCSRVLRFIIPTTLLISFASDCACCWSSSSCSNIIWLDCASWRATKSSSIWPESGLKRRSPGSKKHMLIRSTIVRIRTRRDHFWSSSVLVELHQIKTHATIYEEMERNRWPIGGKANSRFLLFSKCFDTTCLIQYWFWNCPSTPNWEFGLDTSKKSCRSQMFCIWYSSVHLSISK